MFKDSALRFISTLLLLLVYTNHLHGQNYNEILGRPTDSAVTISILSDRDIDVYWQYGTVPGNYPYSTASGVAFKDIPLEAEVTGLLPDKQYYYRTRYRVNASGTSFSSGTEHTFHTQRAKGSSFSFTIEADEHLYDKKGVRNLYKICLENQSKDKPDFMLSLGDIFGDDHHPFDITSKQMDSLHKMYRPYLGSICHSVPYYVCLGNHEGEFNYYLAQTPPENMAVYGTLWRKFYYPNPFPNNFYSGNTDIEPYGMGNPENYYSWTWGDALLVVMDVYRYQCDTSAKPTNWEWSIGLPQYTWLKNTLEQSTSKYKFVFAHHVRGQGRGGITNAKLFEWGGYEQNGTTYSFTQKRPGWAKPIHQLFVDNSVNIFFQGHDHLFAHEVLDGVTYQEVPMPSDSTYELGMLANADAYVSDTIPGSGHLRVNVSSSCVKVDFVRAYLPNDTLSGIHHNRDVAFSYSIGSCPTAGVENVTQSPDVNVFPNPASDILTVSITGGGYIFRLIDILGQTLLQTRSNTMDVSNIRNGLYVLSIKSENFELNKKILVSH
ncbi:MAG: T9SS type A sorting domain-containing protein [Bacteroidota bacterium]